MDPPSSYINWQLCNSETHEMNYQKLSSFSNLQISVYGQLVQLIYYKLVS